MERYKKNNFLERFYMYSAFYLSQNKFLVTYWDLRCLYFLNTWNWFHSPVIIPLNLTYGTSAYVFKTSFWFYKHAYILFKHAAIEFSIFMFIARIINVFYHIFVSEVTVKTRIIIAKYTRPTFFDLTLLSICNYLKGLILFDYNAS